MRKNKIALQIGCVALIVFAAFVWPAYLYEWSSSYREFKMVQYDLQTEAIREDWSRRRSLDQLWQDTAKLEERLRSDQRFGRSLRALQEPLGDVLQEFLDLETRVREHGLLTLPSATTGDDAETLRARSALARWIVTNTRHCERVRAFPSFDRVRPFTLERRWDGRPRSISVDAGSVLVVPEDLGRELTPGAIQAASRAISQSEVIAAGAEAATCSIFGAFADLVLDRVKDPVVGADSRSVSEVLSSLFLEDQNRFLAVRSVHVISQRGRRAVYPVYKKVHVAGPPEYDPEQRPWWSLVNGLAPNQCHLSDIYGNIIRDSPPVRTYFCRIREGAGRREILTLGLDLTSAAAATGSASLGNPVFPALATFEPSTEEYRRWVEGRSLFRRWLDNWLLLGVLGGMLLGFVASWREIDTSISTEIRELDIDPVESEQTASEAARTRLGGKVAGKLTSLVGGVIEKVSEKGIIDVLVRRREWKESDRMRAVVMVRHASLGVASLCGFDVRIPTRFRGTEKPQLRATRVIVTASGSDELEYEAQRGARLAVEEEHWIAKHLFEAARRPEQDREPQIYRAAQGMRTQGVRIVKRARGSGDGWESGCVTGRFVPLEILAVLHEEPLDGGAKVKAELHLDLFLAAVEKGMMAQLLEGSGDALDVVYVLVPVSQESQSRWQKHQRDFAEKWQHIQSPQPDRERIKLRALPAQDPTDKAKWCSNFRIIRRNGQGAVFEVRGVVAAPEQRGATFEFRGSFSERPWDLAFYERFREGRIKDWDRVSWDRPDGQGDPTSA